MVKTVDAGVFDFAADWIFPLGKPIDVDTNPRVMDLAMCIQGTIEDWEREQAEIAYQDSLREPDPDPCHLRIIGGKGQQ